MLHFVPICVVCKKEAEKVVSYLKNEKGCRITKAVCIQCLEKTKDKWLSNGYQMLQ